MLQEIRKYENLHIVLWLFKDICWVNNWHWGGMAMIIPTFLVALHITWLSRSIRSELYHNVAVTMWIMANGVWMGGEFYCDDCTRPYAIVFFVIGITVIGYYYATYAIEKIRSSKA